MLNRRNVVWNYNLSAESSALLLY